MRIPVLPFLLMALAPQAVLAEDEVLAKSLVKMRAEVESLSEQLDLVRVTSREMLVAGTQRQADLDAELQQAQLRMQRLRAAVHEQKALAVQQSQTDAAIKPAVLQAGEHLLTQVRTGLPFRPQERSASIEALLEKLRTGALSPARVATRLWATAQDELRLTKESGLYRQPIVIDGQEVLADVVRIGMVLLYFRTPEGEVGRAAYDGQWHYQRAADDVERRQVNQLFDSFKKQIRVGYFQLPISLRAEARQ